MKLRIPNVAGSAQPSYNKVVELLPTSVGPGNSAFVLVDLEDDTEDVTMNRRFPLTLEGSAERTVKGVRRVMLKCSVKLPASAFDSRDGMTQMPTSSSIASDKSREMSLHAVLTIPKGVEFTVEGGSSYTQIPERAVQVLVAALCALLTGNQGIDGQAQNADLVMEMAEAPLARGLVSTWPLDTLAGSYGPVVTP